MRRTAILMAKELGDYFTSPITYVLMAIFSGVAGFLFYNLTSFFALQCAQSIQYQADYGVKLPPMNANQWVVAPFFVNIATVVLFLVPILTMRSYAGERNEGTAELMMTLPFRTAEIVAAKFVAAMILYTVFVGITAVFMLILNHYTQNGLDWGHIAAGYLGLLLMGAGIIPIGQFISTLTRNQFVAAFVSFAVFLILWMVSWSTVFYYGTTAQILGTIGLSPHILNFTRGIVDSADIVYFASLGAVGLFFTGLSLQMWRIMGA